ncbi:MAG: glycoside hydrolase family 27 protein [Bacteroidota bacterium]
MKKFTVFAAIMFFCAALNAQTLAPTPPMGWMTWNYFADSINEKDIRQMADVMVSSGMAAAGYNYIFIDDGWTGGRDRENNIIADPQKFPSGIKALASYLHDKGLKIGIYSDAAQLTCGGYTASYGFEQQDARTFASWGIDYLKYDYCGAPGDSVTAKTRYKAMADALRKSGRNIVFSICEWGHRFPWLWAAAAGGQLWRCAGDVRDKWRDNDPNRNPPYTGAYGISDIIDDNAALSKYSGPGRWSDMDMLVVGMYGKEGPSSMYEGTGCTDIEYQTQMSMWCMMASPLAASNDIRNMNEATKRILMNRDVIALDQDPLGRQAELKVKNDNWYVFLKPLANGDKAVSILNRSNLTQTYTLDFKTIGLPEQYEITDLWEHKVIGNGSKWQGKILSHETKVFRLVKK